MMRVMENLKRPKKPISVSYNHISTSKPVIPPTSLVNSFRYS